MMGMFAPVVTEVCLTNPCTGLFSGDDLSIPGGVKPKQAQKQKHIRRRADRLPLLPTVAEIAECGVAGIPDES